MRFAIRKGVFSVPAILAILTVLFNDNALLVATSLSSTQYAFASLIIYIFVLIYIVATGRQNKKTGLSFAFVVICYSLILLTCIINFDFSIHHFLVVFLLFQAYVVARTMSFQEYAEKYVMIMGSLALISIIMQTITTAIPSILSIAKKSYNSNNILFYNFFLYFRSTNEAFRNYGIFTEPGDHQHYLNIALVLFLFIIDNERIRKKKWIPVALTIAIITTFSPAGVVFVACTWVAYLFKNTRDIKRTASLVFGGIVLILIALSNENVSSGVHYAILKLTGQVSTSQEGRLAGVQAGLEVFKHNPLFGTGFKKASSIMVDIMTSEADTASQTSTITAFLAFFGLPFTMLVTIPYFKALIPKRLNLFSKMFLFIGIMLSINNERYVWELTYYIFVLYGVALYSRKNCSDWKDVKLLYSE